MRGICFLLIWRYSIPFYFTFLIFFSNWKDCWSIFKYFIHFFIFSLDIFVSALWEFISISHICHYSNHYIVPFGPHKYKVGIYFNLYISFRCVHFLMVHYKIHRFELENLRSCFHYRLYFWECHFTVCATYTGFYLHNFCDMIWYTFSCITPI